MLDLIAQTAPSGQEWVGLAQYGVLGLLVLALIRRWLVTKGELDEMQRRAEKSEAENDRMHKVMEEQVIPALSRSTDVIARYIEKRTST